MVKRTLPRRLTALLLAGLVCAASSGLAIHDPDCAHHQHGAAAHEDGHAGHVDAGPASAGHAASDVPAGHAATHAPAGDAPAGQDCQCLGFCALAGQVHATVATGAGQLRLAAAPPTVVGRASAAHRVPTRVPALQPPATGPPVLS